MKLNTEIKTAHLLTGIGLCILLGLLLAYLFEPKLFSKPNTESIDIYKFGDTQGPISKPKLTK